MDLKMNLMVRFTVGLIAKLNVKLAVLPIVKSTAHLAGKVSVNI